jgi:hypothetical protein
MRHGVHRLLVHEVPGARLGDNEERHACSFEQIIATTPKHVYQASLYNEIAQNVVGGTLRAAGLAKMAIKLAEGSGSRNQWTYEPNEPLPDVVRYMPAATQPCMCDEHIPDHRQHTVCAQVEVVVVHEPLGISLVQRGSHVVVSGVEPASMAAVQRVRMGSVLDAVNGQAVGNMEENAVIEMIQAAERPWRLLLRVSPPPIRQNAASANLGGAQGERNAGTNETPGLSMQRSRDFSSRIIR